ncbi:hypothetical protein ACU635_14180 [[Actinomadura] parvosata]|uniref:hypothetical protein n=1 Tax=[Actinomadura] parvosata TaxID=1955412 RepID=UPI00406C5F7C
MNAAAQRRAIDDAVAALAHRLRQRDQLAAQERPDAHAFALEFVTAMHGHGWRPTNAQRNPWVSKPIRDHSDAAARGAALARQLLEHGPASISDDEEEHQ